MAIEQTGEVNPYKLAAQDALEVTAWELGYRSPDELVDLDPEAAKQAVVDKVFRGDKETAVRHIADIVISPLGTDADVTGKE